MSKLTDYLRALLARFYSKNENGAIGHQAMINTSAETTFTTQNFIAPSDGYIATDATSTTGGNTAVFAYVNSKCVHGVINAQAGHQSFVVNASCKKGDNVLIDKAGDISISTRFYRTIGGGINRFISCFKEACYA